MELQASFFIELFGAFIFASHMLICSFFNTLFISVNQEEEKKGQDDGTAFPHLLLFL